MKLNELSRQDIENCLEERSKFTGTASDLYSRHSAYDYCYNYFRDFYEKDTDILSNEKIGFSCFQLGLFLSTWGMYRNSFLQRRSFKIYENLIEEISKEKRLWKIDVEDYCLERGVINEKTSKAIMNFKENIKESFPNYKFKDNEKISVTNTLATKIMMVVFGCVPAYDNYFTSTLDHPSFNEDSLIEIYNFYSDYRDVLNQKQKELKTVNVNGGLTEYTYKKAKIIDLIGFRVREKEIEEEKRLVNKKKDWDRNKKIDESVKKYLT